MYMVQLLNMNTRTIAHRILREYDFTNLIEIKDRLTTLLLHTHTGTLPELEQDFNKTASLVFCYGLTLGKLDELFEIEIELGKNKFVDRRVEETLGILEGITNAGVLHFLGIDGDLHYVDRLDKTTNLFLSGIFRVSSQYKPSEHFTIMFKKKKPG